jgi:hypothetical protein
MKNLIRSLFAFATALSIQACSNDARYMYGNGYYMQGNSCYNQSGQVVAPTLCSNAGYSNNNSGYVLQNGSCYSTYQNTYVDISYCNNSSQGIGGQQQCIGTYYSNTNGTMQPISCNGSNCRGYTLYTAQGTAVYCQ